MPQNNKLPFGRKNYIFMIVGVLVLTLGFVLMTLDSEPYGFGFLGLTLGPVLVFAGFMIEIVAILYDPQKRDK